MREEEYIVGEADIISWCLVWSVHAVCVCVGEPMLHIAKPATLHTTIFTGVRSTCCKTIAVSSAFKWALFSDYQTIPTPTSSSPPPSLPPSLPP